MKYLGAILLENTSHLKYQSPLVHENEALVPFLGLGSLVKLVYRLGCKVRLRVRCFFSIWGGWAWWEGSRITA